MMYTQSNARHGSGGNLGRLSVPNSIKMEETGNCRQSKSSPRRCLVSCLQASTLNRASPSAKQRTLPSSVSTPVTVAPVATLSPALTGVPMFVAIVPHAAVPTVSPAVMDGFNDTFVTPAVSNRWPDSQGCVAVTLETRNVRVPISATEPSLNIDVLRLGGRPLDLLLQAVEIVLPIFYLDAMVSCPKRTPPLPGPRESLCWTLKPSKCRTMPLSISMGTSTMSVRFGCLSVSNVPPPRCA